MESFQYTETISDDEKYKDKLIDLLDYSIEDSGVEMCKIKYD